MNDKEIAKKYGDLSVISGDNFVDLDSNVVPISPALDIVTGGVVGGSYVVLTGNPKCGKTVTALQIAKNAQKFGRKVYYFNIEGRLKRRDLQGIKGLILDKDHFEVVRSYRDKSSGETRILLAHEFLEIAEYYIHTVPGSVLILDSISMLLSSDERTGEITKQHRAPGAKLMANFLRRMSNVVPVNDNIVICIQQIIADTGFGPSTKVRSGGRKIAYAMDVDLEAVKVERIENANGIPYAQKILWKTGATSASISPGQKIHSILRYGIGIDEIAELIEIGIGVGFIEQSGSWLKMKYMEDHNPVEGVKYQEQGKEKLYQRLVENPEEFSFLEQDIKQMGGI